MHGNIRWSLLTCYHFLRVTSLCFCVLQAIKNWRRQQPRNEATHHKVRGKHFKFNLNFWTATERLLLSRIKQTRYQYTRFFYGLLWMLGLEASEHKAKMYAYVSFAHCKQALPGSILWRAQRWWREMDALPLSLGLWRPSLSQLAPSQDPSLSSAIEMHTAACNGKLREKAMYKCTDLEESKEKG